MRALKIVCIGVWLTWCVGASIQVQAQGLGDYRSVATGNWSSPSTWQYFNGSVWQASTTYPGEIATIGDVTLRSPHVITVDIDPGAAGFQMVNVFVNQGATLTDAVGSLYYLVAPSNRFNIDGIVSLTNSTNTGSGVFGGNFTISATGNLAAHTAFIGQLSNFGTATITTSVINNLAINTATNTGIWVNQTNSVFNFGGSSITAGLRASATGNTVNYYSSTSNQTVRVPVTSYFNLTLSGNGGTTKTLGSDAVILGTLSIQGNSRFFFNSFNLTVHGDWNNSSTNTVAVQYRSLEDTIVAFRGSSSQNIINTGHVSGITFNNLTLANTSTISPQIVLSNTSGIVLIYNSLTMNSGDIVDLGGGQVQLGPNYTSTTTLTHSGLASAGWFYNGSFARPLVTNAAIPNGSNNGLFPIGTSTNFRPFYAATATPPSVSSRITVSSPGSTSFVNVSLADGTSSILRQNRSGWGVNTSGNGTYNIQAGGAGLGVIGNVADLRLTPAASVTGSAGTNTGTTANPLVERTGVTMTNLNNTFYVGSVNLTSSPLPVELISFNGQAEGSVVNLNWVTKSEINCDYFTVYRSANGIDFAPVGSRKGAGTTKEQSNYDLQDPTPLNGTNYYRLEQTDWDGTKTILSMISVEANGSEVIQVYPNPVAEGQSVDLKLQGLASHASQSIYVFDYLGRQVLNSIIAVDESGSFNGKLKLPQLSAGCYFIKINSNTKRLIIR